MKKIHLITVTAFITCLLFFSGSALATEEIKDFTFDGCSSIAPEGTPCDTNLWCECCLDHDREYWEGGSWTDRRNADLELMNCVAEKSGSQTLGLLYYLGVRAGGSPFFNTSYRWGYGWDYGRDYQTMTEEEAAIADEKFEMYMNENPDPCSEY